MVDAGCNLFSYKLIIYIIKNLAHGEFYKKKRFFEKYF